MDSSNRGPDDASHLDAALWTRQKRIEILSACQSRDVAALSSLAQSRYGLLSDSLRKAAWPILLGLPLPPPLGADAPPAADDDWKDLPCHRDEDQVQLDVNRSFVYYPAHQSETELERCKLDLSCLIIEVLRRNPYLCYFQGYHDICQVFLLVLGPVRRAEAVARLSVLRIRDFMLPSLAPTTAQLRLLPDILTKADPELRRHIASVEPFYALAGTLTMYAHNIERYRDIVRLFDVLLAREPVFTIYLFACIVMDRRDEVFDIDEPDMLQVVLAKVPADMDIDGLVVKAVALYDRFPPQSLPAWRQISKASVLKTARDVCDCATQTLQQGRAYFQRQVSELWWLNTRQNILLVFGRYRRPVRAIGMAFAVAAVAFYLRQNPAAMRYLTSLFSK
ncbi:hypothetical protein CDD81_7325 [Ophiocordyceps australis]|uniref:Rab-GAP TBC domain-containing protein n=1 Tax=Ophiocordyceps australis TaxID=1399860 RepID=A0A2C5XYC6_9HYPO|nr:hypothetical protein CDD81_7325 [Ophiocordyceps australis]